VLKLEYSIWEETDIKINIMAKKLKTGLNSQFVFSENNQVLINCRTNEEEWSPINFQWIPIVKLRKKMK
jgi:hypothetical protein